MAGKVKVKILVCAAGPNEVRNVGDVLDVSEAEAKRLFMAGSAEPVSKVERATKRTKPETRKK